MARENDFELEAQWLIEHNLFPLVGDITDDRLKKLKRSFLTALRTGVTKATLVLSTPGGDCQPGLWFFDTLRNLPLEIVGFVVGQCESLGVVILQACAERIATRHSSFLVHSVRSTFEFSPNDPNVEERFREQLAASEVTQEQIVRILSGRSGRTRDEVRKLIRKGDAGERISADRAKELGLVDAVVDRHPLFPNAKL